MSQRRSITDFFRRPAFSLTRHETPENQMNIDSSDEPHGAPQSSPLTELSSSFLSNPSSPTLEELPASAHCQLNDPLLFSVKDSAEEKSPQRSFQSQSTGTAAGSSTLGVNISQRIIKNGRPVVISSDGEDTESLEDPEDLFKGFTSPSGDAKDNNKQGMSDTPTGTNMALRPQGAKGKANSNKLVPPNTSAPKKYKFTLDSLVTHAVDDREIEANVAELKATFEAAASARDLQSSIDDATASAGGQRRGLHKDILTTALDDNDDGLELQRLYDAVRRTEAFDQERTWSFFDHNIDLPPPPEFPQATLAPGTYVAVLRDAASRERAFHSGVVEFALSRNFLPDELVTWVFHSVPSEPRDDLRQIYCRVFKNATADRIKSLIRPSDVDEVFRRLGARPKALTLSEPIVPETPSKHGSSENTLKSRAALLSVFDLLGSAADLFADDTRERILHILFCLTIDMSLVGDSTVCSELERAITAVLESISDESMMQSISTWVYDNIRDVVFQSRVLRHTLPTSEWIALFRCRLAVAFLIRDPSPLSEEPEAVLDLKRITNMLKDRRFDVKACKGKRDVVYDYEELGATTTLLNIAVDSGSFKFTPATKEAEFTFNKDVDKLAERIKKIFTSIEDSGASHLKRTQAKEGLEALHYRIVYSVRSKPPPKKTLFRAHGNQDWKEVSRSSSFLEKYLTPSSAKNEEKKIPIRDNDGTS